MKSKLLLVGVGVLVLTWGAGLAQAGVIRAAAKQVDKGSVAAPKGTPKAAGAAAYGFAAAGKATGNALKTGASSAGKGVVETPGLAARGAKAVWKAVW
ncbi:MAG: hypothetical protein ABSF71_03735 [Terriglobia bacterium]|jgi:hypothetical protein